MKQIMGEQMGILVTVIKCLAVCLALVTVISFLLAGILYAYTVNDVAKDLERDNCTMWCKR